MISFVSCFGGNYEGWLLTLLQISFLAYKTSGGNKRTCFIVFKCAIFERIMAKNDIFLFISLHLPFEYCLTPFEPWGYLVHFSDVDVPIFRVWFSPIFLELDINGK